MTPQQLQTLKTAIAADPILAAQPANSDGDFAIAAALNQSAVPDFFVWRSSVGVDEIMQNGFDWTRVDNLTVGKARIWDWMMRTVAVNPARANVRAGVLATFSTAGDAATRQAVFNHFQRVATRFEKLFATGNGTTSSVDGVGPATMALESPVSFETVGQARAA